jgi:hypothetical protein
MKNGYMRLIGMKTLVKGLLIGGLTALASVHTIAQTTPELTDQSRFRQLGQELPTPNTYRSASGAPGHEYWQQRADYDISVTLNDDDLNPSVDGVETITYYNNSPDELRYVWLQLDQNIFKPNGIANLTNTSTIEEAGMSVDQALKRKNPWAGGYTIKAVTDVAGKGLPYTINETMMRVDLPMPLKSKGTYSFKVSWYNLINEGKKQGGRGAYEHFDEDNNNLYEMAQWFPRMCVYDDVWGWQHKQYLGRGEFALEFGNYRVKINVPADHIVGATGELQNSAAVLTATQISRLRTAETAKHPLKIVSEDDALEAIKTKAKGRKTWEFYAKNVRDFAWASSRRFIWDAMRINVAGKPVWAMSYYPKEGNPLWGKYSTEVVAHTIKVYSRYSINYNYPVAISVHGPIGGMEYPMICFNGGRPLKDGTYSERTKYGMISVIIHEVGHNFFPMIISSDERQWSWMDEGLNTFMQYLTEQEWQRDYPSQRGEPYKIAAYMKSDKAGQAPIMVNSESAINFGNNAYGKPATGLNILRETILGRKLFDYAFKEYCRRWAFKHPAPADFFRTMEDASGTDLDWFWRAWFYTTNHVDIAITGVKHTQLGSPDPAKALAAKKADEQEPVTLSSQRNLQDIKATVVEENPDMKDFYNSYDQYKPSAEEVEKYQKALAVMKPEEKALYENGLHFYQLNFENRGGVMMPIILRMEFANGKDSVARIPVEVWRLNDKTISKVFMTDQPVQQFTLDPYLETADVDTDNNFYPAKNKASRFQLFKEAPQGPRFGPQQGPNPMQRERQKTSK